MFAKKFLSIVSLLFLGSQITSVYGTCTITIGESLTTCSKKDGSECNDGYYVVFPTTDGDYTANDSGSDGKLILLSESQTACNFKSDVGYFKSGEANKYISNSYENKANLVTSGEGCTAGQVDSNESYKLCLDGSANDGTKKVAIDRNNGNLYVVPNTGNLLASSGANALVKSVEDALIYVTPEASTNYLAVDIGGILSSANDIIAVDSNVALDTSISGKEYCVDNDTKIITERPKNYCDTVSDPAINCDKYFTCTDGVCLDTTTVIDVRSGSDADTSCNPATANAQYCTNGGYYIVYNSALLPDSTTNSGAGTLYHCSGSPVACSVDNTTIGYLKNADTEHNSDAGIPYIECKATTSTTTNANGKMVTQNSCKAIVKPGSACSLGALIYDSKYKLCITASSSVDSTAANYLVDAHGQSTFEATAGIQENYFVVVEIDGQGNFIRRAQTGKKYIYALKSGKRVYNKGETGYSAAMCTGEPSSLNESVAEEYILNKTEGDLVDYYKVNA